MTNKTPYRTMQILAAASVFKDMDEGITAIHHSGGRITIEVETGGQYDARVTRKATYGDVYHYFKDAILRSREQKRPGIIDGYHHD